jgi:hypothetical protein
VPDVENYEISCGWCPKDIPNHEENYEHQQERHRSSIFVGVVQAFVKVPALAATAPKQTEPSFVVTQLVVLALFIALTIVAAKKS